MKNYVLRRLMWGLAALVVITSVNFVIIKMVPGDPVIAIIGEYPAPPEYIAEITRDFGLDQPLYVQFWRYMTSVVQGDLGFSFANRASVLPLILDRAQYSLMLVVPAILISLVLGVSLALISARRAHGPLDTGISSFVLLGYSMPSFWLGQLLVLLFAVGLSWLPAAGMRSLRVEPTGWAGIWDVWLHMLMPMACIISFKLAVILRVARASVIGVLHEDFVMTARAKGASESWIIWRHVLPNSIVPVIAVLGYNFGHCLTSSILVETVFAWPGLGSLFVSSITTRDFPVLQGILILSTALVVLANLLADLAASAADPRVRRNLGTRNV